MKTKISKGLIYNQKLKIKQRWKTRREDEDGSNDSTTPVKRCLMICRWKLRLLTNDGTSVVKFQWKITTSVINYRRFSSSLVNCRGLFS